VHATTEEGLSCLNAVLAFMGILLLGKAIIPQQPGTFPLYRHSINFSAL
jgi:hypothetical protein